MSNMSRHKNLKVLSLFISLEITCFLSRWTVNICTAGQNRRAGYATVHDYREFDVFYNVIHSI